MYDPRRHKFFRAAFAALLISFPVADAPADERQFSAGFTEFAATGHEAQTLSLGIWYPSTSAETAGKLGPFRPTWAWDGEAAAGSFPIIVLSHGRTGRYRNHRQTAATLARSGYVVVAPDHLHDRQMVSKRKIIPVVARRAEELKLALSAVRRNPRTEKIADANRIGVIGYSLGTLTALYAAGTTPKMALWNQHCRLHGETDSNFCGDGWMSGFFRAIRSVVSYLNKIGILKSDARASDDAEEFPPIRPPLAADAIALVAPVGVLFEREKLQAQTAAIALFRLGDDDELRYPWHAEYLHQTLEQIPKPHVYRQFEDVHHYAFISPFPKWLLEEEAIPVALDPEGFDRAAFIRKINADLVEFFRRNL